MAKNAFYCEIQIYILWCFIKSTKMYVYIRINDTGNVIVATRGFYHSTVVISACLRDRISYTGMMSLYWNSL